MKIYLRRLRLNSGGYHYNRYYGIGQPLFEYWLEDENKVHEIRADTRNHAKSIIRAKHPEATFFSESKRAINEK